MDFEWDKSKEALNIEKHGVSFSEAIEAFADVNCVIVPDELHSGEEDRFFCFGRVGNRVMTVRFTVRTAIRIIGAAYWRKGKKLYEKSNQS